MLHSPTNEINFLTMTIQRQFQAATSANECIEN